MLFAVTPEHTSQSQQLHSHCAPCCFQTARVAALLQRFGAAGLTSQSTQISPNPSNTSWPPFNAPNPLIIPNNTCGSGSSGAYPGSSGFSGYGSLINPTAGFPDSGISPGSFNPGLDFSGSAGGLESGQSSAGNNVQSSAGNNVQSMAGSEGFMGGGTGAGLSGLGSGANAMSAGGLTSPEAVYGTDGLDVPGTAQVGCIFAFCAFQHLDSAVADSLQARCCAVNERCSA